jgi:GTP pyrophosphokinase
MVKVRETHTLRDDGSIDVEQWLALLPVSLSESERAKIDEACQLLSDLARKQKGQDSEQGDLLAGLEMAQILADLHLDSEALLAALLYRPVERNLLELKDISKQFGATVLRLLKDVMRMAAIGLDQQAHESDFNRHYDQKVNIRRMLVAMVDDVRVALIKLAERTCTIREVKAFPDRQVQVAREVSDLYAPLAHRLGIGHIKWELEDLSFRYLEPETYKTIARQLNERRLPRQDYIKRVIAELKQALEKEGIQAEFSGRAKHIYSIWRKMHRKQVSFSEIYDIRAVRILVGEVRDCYQALGIVHSLWRTIPHEFDDYIATPKSNGYRSLHTAVIGPEGKVLEIQIRTREMHEEAELGVCSHWVYKGTDKEHRHHQGYEEKIAWLRQVLDWQDELEAAGDFDEQVKNDFIQDRIYVFTPDGHVVDLANGSTPVDFAYHIHTEVGHRCRGAKVDGRIVPLTYQLQTGEKVEIMTGGELQPSRDWLRTDLAYLKTSRARAKVQHWFKQQAREENVLAGRNLLEKEFKRLALTSLDYKLVADRVNYASVEDMYAAVGAGDLGANQVLRAAQQLVKGPGASRPVIRPATRQPEKDSGIGEVLVHGVGNLMSHLAGCCKPVPGDEITGYITLGRGVTIHRRDCGKSLELQKFRPERVIEVEWGEQQRRTYASDVSIEAFDRTNLLRDITMLLSTEHINLLAVNTSTDLETNMAKMEITVETTGLDSLGSLLAKISQVPNVVSVKRVREGDLDV